MNFLSIPPEEWEEQAFCATYPDPELWHLQPPLAEEPKRLCNQRCPVREECLTFAMKHRIPYGIWGGMTTHERDGIRHNIKPRKPPQ